MDQTFIAYYNELKAAYDTLPTGEIYFTTNTDRLHNAAVMELMLEKGRVLNMYCGSMSIFSNSFYTHIENESDRKEIKGRIAEAFTKFINDQDKSINIIVEQYDESIFYDLICSKDLFKNNSVSIYSVPDAIKNRGEIGHFSFIDNSIITRIETDADEHRAIIKIGISDKVRNPMESFERLKGMSRKINLN